MGIQKTPPFWAEQRVDDLRRRTGDLRGLADIRLVTLENGPGRGQRLLLCRNAAGVELEVAVDRGFDPSALRFRGINLGWSSPVGFAAPTYPGELDGGLGLLRHFDGLLVTCGLDHYGAPTQGPAQHLAYGPRKSICYPLHGRVSAQPATVVGYGISEGPSATIWCEAEIRQAAVFGEVLLLRRRIEMALFEPRIDLTDVVVNRGFRPSRHAVLYHFNLGFPLLDEGCELIGDLGELRDALRVSPPVPTDDAQERVDLIEPACDPEGRIDVGLRNPNLLGGVSLHIEFRKAQLPQLALWRCWQSGIYTLGIEPCTGLPPDALTYRGEGTPHFLEAGAEARYELTLKITEDPGQ